MSLKLFIILLLAAGVVAADPPPPVPTLVTYRKELGLTDLQVAGIQKAVEEFRQQAVLLNGKVQAALAAVNTDLTRRAELPTLKAHLKAYYDARFELHYADLVSGRRLEALLTQEQLQRWRAMQSEAMQKKLKPQSPQGP